MRLFNYLLLALIFSSSCKNESSAPNFDENYGEGMYIVTDMGVSFYNYKDSLAEVSNQIYMAVNNISINQPKKIKFSGSKAYIIAENDIVVANVNTFESKGMVTGFVNPVNLDFVSDNRLFVVDKDDSKVKVVDLISMEITSDIETGDSTSPVFIISNSKTSFIMNGGGPSNQIKDSTVVAIAHRYGAVGIADFEGSISVGDNPNSAVILPYGGRLKVLSQGVYDTINTSGNTESSLSTINQYSNKLYSTDNLAGIYNAKNLINNDDHSNYYFIAEEGVYTLDIDALSANQIVSVNASIINTIIEPQEINDTTIVYYEMLYMNDKDSPNSIYKYNLTLTAFEDTIIVNGNVRDINFY